MKMCVAQAIEGKGEKDRNAGKKRLKPKSSLRKNIFFPLRLRNLNVFPLCFPFDIVCLWLVTTLVTELCDDVRIVGVLWPKNSCLHSLVVEVVANP